MNRYFLELIEVVEPDFNHAFVERRELESVELYSDEDVTFERQRIKMKRTHDLGVDADRCQVCGKAKTMTHAASTCESNDLPVQPSVPEGTGQSGQDAPRPHGGGAVQEKSK